MAITASKIANVPPPVSSGCDGCEIHRFVGDNSATSLAYTLPASSNIKKIKGAIIGGGIGGSHNITASTTNAVTITWTTAPGNGITIDVLIFGSAG